ncbi:hypothetical protein CHUAL_001898 [Chamberlinius hualienensis]
MPREWQNSSNLWTLDPKDFEMKTNIINCDIIDHNLDTYRALIFPDSQGPTVNSSFTQLKGLELTIGSGLCEQYLRFDSNENYFIEIKEGNPLAQLRANTVWGGLRALETFSQLVFQGEDGKYYVNDTKISDSPRFQHRGLMLDTARHFLPKSILLRNLDAMQWNKMNVFHWHITDDQSFPFESSTFPNLTTFGAYSPKHVYTPSDVAEIIEYARLRGIRVIPEFDSPGHTRSIGNAFRNLLTPCYGDGVHPYTPNYTAYSDAEVFNPINEDVYKFMKDLISEVKTVFKDEYVHLGLDEVWYDCWKSNPDITKFMKENNMTEYSDVEGYYVKKLIDIVANLGYKYISWQDPVDNGVKMNDNTIIQIWKDSELDAKLKPWRQYIVPIAQQGYKMILSSCWYLNYISYGPDWKNYYKCDPHDFDGNDEQKTLVIGGEAAMWGEYVDGTNILARIWPRASAVAERLWSPSSVNDTDSANFRLDQQRCRMLRRGTPAQPILNGFCGDYEWGMPQNLRK